MSFHYKTKGNSLPDNKPRVFFTCHPDDFEAYFEQTCQSIFKSHDCTVYYLQNHTSDVQPEDLQRMNLFVIPVTLHLLRKKNRTLDEFLPFALKEHIPVLPLMMEENLDSLYSQPDCFGELQYLKPHSDDLTEISFSEKLKRYLESVLIGHETANRIRAAFDSYIFLSYRKKDRKYAQELMRLIHQNDVLNDTAIWYDEFLTPGESFEENIHRMLKNSQLFALLVTPSLMEEVNHLPNYVVQHEYPAALHQKIPVVPAEMVATSQEELHQNFPHLPECSNPYDEQFIPRLVQTLKKEAVSPKGKEHNYLIGLAYLEGIDVETNTAKGISLIRNAADHKLPEAAKKLYTMYSQGIHVSIDYHQALHYAKLLKDIYQTELGSFHPDTIEAMKLLSVAYSNAGDYQKEFRTKKDVFFALYHLHGKKHVETLNAMERIAFFYQNELGENSTARDLFHSVVDLKSELLGESHPETISSQLSLAISYSKSNKRKAAHAIREKLYHLCCKTYESNHPVYLSVIKELAKNYGDQRNHQKALELKIQIADTYRKQYGELHSLTIQAFNSIAFSYRMLKQYDDFLTIRQKIYHLLCEKYSDIHPASVSALTGVAFAYRLMGRMSEALQCYEQAYQQYLDIYEETHPELAEFYSSYSIYCSKCGLTKKAEELHQKADAATKNKFEKRSEAKKTYTDEEVTTDDPEERILVCQKTAEEYSILFGEDHEKTLKALNQLALAFSKANQSDKALKLYEQIYSSRVLTIGEYHPDTLTTMKNLMIVYKRLGYDEKSEQLKQELKRIQSL